MIKDYSLSPGNSITDLNCQKKLHLLVTVIFSKEGEFTVWAQFLSSHNSLHFTRPCHQLLLWQIGFSDEGARFCLCHGVVWHPGIIAFSCCAFHWLFSTYGREREDFSPVPTACYSVQSLTPLVCLFFFYISTRCLGLTWCFLWFFGVLVFLFVCFLGFFFSCFFILFAFLTNAGFCPTSSSPVGHLKTDNGNWAAWWINNLHWTWCPDFQRVLSFVRGLW